MTYGESVRFFLIDVKDIKSNIPRSTFDERELNDLATSILEMGCLLQPIILRQTGITSFEVIEGHKQFYAAVRAKEIDRIQGEMVSAFVIQDECQSIAIEQMALLNNTAVEPVEVEEVVEEVIEAFEIPEKEYSTARFYLNDLPNKMAPTEILLETPRSAFDENELREIAKSILNVGVLLQPIVIEQIDLFKYKLLDEGQAKLFWASVVAKEMDTDHKTSCSMFSCFTVFDLTHRGDRQAVKNLTEAEKQRDREHILTQLRLINA